MTDSPAERWLARAQWQPVIFADVPRRADLLALVPDWPLRPFRMTVIRNQPFEFIASVLTPFLAFAGLAAEATYSDYDDSIGLQPDAPLDVALVWLDFGRYDMQPAQLLDWIRERLTALRSSTDAPVLIADSAGDGERVERLNAGLREAAARLPGVSVADQSAVAHALGPAYNDRRAARITGTTMSDLAFLETARHMGLGWIPAVLAPAIRAVTIDLDGTLYEGVLGEDGPSGIVVTPAHRQLHQRLLELRESGVFLAAVTRNEPTDVTRLFAERTDLLLHPEHFSSMVASWESKADGVRRVARDLRIGEDTILLIDDNPGELAAVAEELPGIEGLHASDPAITTRALGMFPGLYRFSRSAADRVRVQDVKAASAREQLERRSADPGDYLRSLRVELSFAVDARADVQRLHELSVKTNQFNTALRRFSATEVVHYMTDERRHAISIALADRLSNSGIVGAVFTRRDGRRLVVDEVAISCRALGRRLEGVMVTEALRRAAGDAPPAEVKFAFTDGPRNGPARAFLMEMAGQLANGDVVLPWSTIDGRRAASMPIRITGRAA